MSRTTKLLLIGGAAVLVVGIGLVVGGVILYKRTFGERFAAMANEGRDFGKTTDEQGCLKEGFARARKLSSKPDVVAEVANPDFVMGCLRSSKSTPGFCDAAPSTGEWLAGSDEKECEKIDGPKEPCRQVLKQRFIYCGNLKRGLVPGKSISPSPRS